MALDRLELMAPMCCNDVGGGIVLGLCRGIFALHFIEGAKGGGDEKRRTETPCSAQGHTQLLSDSQDWIPGSVTPLRGSQEGLGS